MAYITARQLAGILKELPPEEDRLTKILELQDQGNVIEGIPEEYQDTPVESPAQRQDAAPELYAALRGVIPSSRVEGETLKRLVNPKPLSKFGIGARKAVGGIGDFFGFGAPRAIGEMIAAPQASLITEEKLRQEGSKADEIRKLVRNFSDPDLLAEARAEGYTDDEIMAYRDQTLDELRGKAIESQMASQKAYDAFNREIKTTPREIAARTGAAYLGGKALAGQAFLPQGTDLASKTLSRLKYGGALGSLLEAGRGEGAWSLKDAGRIAGAGLTSGAVQALFGAAIDKGTDVLKGVARRTYTTGIGAPKRVVGADIKQGGEAALTGEEAGPRVERLLEKGVSGGKKKLAQKMQDLYATGEKKVTEGAREAQAAGLHVDLQEVLDDALAPFDDVAARTKNPVLVKAIIGLRSRFPNKISITPEQANVIKGDLQDEARALYERTVSPTVAEGKSADMAAAFASALRKRLTGMSEKIGEGLQDESAASFIRSGLVERAKQQANKLPVLIPTLTGIAGGLTGLGSQAVGAKEGQGVDWGRVAQGAGVGAAVGLGTRSPESLTRVGSLMNRAGQALTSGVGEQLRRFAIEKALDAYRGRK